MDTFTRSVLYKGSPINIALPQLQLPIRHRVDNKFLESLDPLDMKDRFINFNDRNTIQGQRLPIRHTFILRGLNSICNKDENQRVFKE